MNIIDYDENINFDQFVNQQIFKLFKIINFKLNREYNRECDCLLFDDFYILFYSYNTSFNQYVFKKYIIPKSIQIKTKYEINFQDYQNSFYYYYYYMYHNNIHNEINILLGIRNILKDFTENDRKYLKKINVSIQENHYEIDLLTFKINKVEKINNNYPSFKYNQVLTIYDYIPIHINNLIIDYEIIIFDENNEIELDPYLNLLLSNYFYNNSDIKKLIDNKILIPKNINEFYSNDLLDFQNHSNIRFNSFKKINTNRNFYELLRIINNYYLNIDRNINYLIHNTKNNLYNQNIHNIFNSKTYKLNNDKLSIIELEELDTILYQIKDSKIINYLSLRFNYNITNNNLYKIQNNKIIIIKITFLLILLRRNFCFISIEFLF